MLQKRHKLLSDKLQVLSAKAEALALQIHETEQALALTEQVQNLSIGAVVQVPLPPAIGANQGIVLGVDREKERVRLFVGTGLNSKAINVHAQYITGVQQNAQTGGVATPSPASSSGAAPEVPAQRRSYAKGEPIRIQ